MSKIYLFRHAQASFGAANYDQLSPKGELQSAALGKYLVEKKVKFDKLFVGPLRRQQHTFEIVKSVYDKHNMDLPTPVMLPELVEHDGFKATRIGLPKMTEKVPFLQELQAEIDENPTLKRRNSLLMFEYFMNEWVDGKVAVEGLETWKTFREKVDKGVDIILENTKKGEQVGAFTSGGTISAIVGTALSVGDEKRIAALNFSILNTSFSTFLYSNEKFNLLSVNELPHLEGDMVTFV